MDAMRRPLNVASISEAQPGVHDSLDRTGAVAEESIPIITTRRTALANSRFPRALWMDNSGMIYHRDRDLGAKSTPARHGAKTWHNPSASKKNNLPAPEMKADITGLYLC